MTIAEEEAIELDGMRWRSFCELWRYLGLQAKLGMALASVGVWVMPEGAKA